jgi:hypothetical protein
MYATGGTIKPRQTKCAKHGLLLRRSIDGNQVCEIWTCPACNADVIDQWAKQPGVIKINIPRP